MKYLVLSDSHGNKALLSSVMCHNTDIDGVFFLGDGISDFCSVMVRYPALKSYIAYGNCDSMGNGAPKTTAILGHNIFYVHGDVFSVKEGINLLAKTAEKKQCDIVLFGHTHIPFYEVVDGITFFNPGALIRNCNGETSYGLMEITEGQQPIFRHIKNP